MDRISTTSNDDRKQLCSIVLYANCFNALLFPDKTRVLALRYISWREIELSESVPLSQEKALLSGTPSVSLQLYNHTESLQSSRQLKSLLRNHEACHELKSSHSNRNFSMSRAVAGKIEC
ncbi:unnamed protein product [Auanema sp. JU1783]|nr:unnamed protein product [Auanema sp. JU1783]